MFLAGADGDTPELRPPSIKGAIRFWWRALNGQLRLRQLREYEGFILGSTSQRSKLLLHIITPKSRTRTATAYPVPHKPFMRREAFQEGSEFTVNISIPETIKSTSGQVIFTADQARDLFILTCLLGGFGKRVRRGMGCVQIIAINDTPYAMPHTLETALPLLQHIAPYFSISSDSIVSNFSGRSEQYPYIKQIQIGRADHRILRKISNTAHEVKGKNKFSYEVSLGHAFKGRFASPVYTSILQSSQGLHPIITTLNTVPDRNQHQVDRSLQEVFKNKIL